MGFEELDAMIDSVARHELLHTLSEVRGKVDAAHDSGEIGLLEWRVLTSRLDKLAAGEK